MSNLADLIKSLSAYEFQYTSKQDNSNLEANSHIANRLSELFAKYKKDVEKISPYSFRQLECSKDDCISKIDTNCNNILKICEKYQQGNIADAIQDLYELYFANNELALASIEGNTDMYRMRSADKNRLFSESEMFHVPFELNYLLKNERYSISGFPSLYLGSSIYVCWEELGRPDFDYSNVAFYKTTNELKLINMKLPRKEQELNLNFILFIPLILASSLVVLHPDGVFKEEYILPQLVMHCLIKYNSANQIKMDGICYESVHTKGKDCWYDKRDYYKKFVNYVFPVIDISPKGQCEQLKKKFRYWTVISFNQYETKFYINIDRKEVDSYNPYNSSKFNILEEYLKKRNPDMLTYDKHSQRGRLT